MNTDHTNFSVPTIGNFTDKLNAVWVEMRDAVKEAVKSYGRDAVNKVVEDSNYIVLNGDKVEFQGTADDIATEVDSILAKLHEINGREDEAPVETPAPKPAPVESAAAKYYHTNLTPDSVRTASVDEIRKFMDDNWDDISSGINEIIYSKEFLDRVVRPMVRDMLEDFDKNQFKDPFAQANEI